MKLQRIGGRKLMLTGSRRGVLALRAVLLVASVGLYVVGFLTVLKSVSLGVLLLVIASVLAIPANALLRAQFQPLRGSEVEAVRRRAVAGR